MKSIITRAIIGFCVVVALGVRAQENEAPEEKSYPISINAEVGTTGIGGTVGWRFHDHLGVRGGMHYLSWSSPDFDVEGDDSEGDESTTTYNARIYLQSQPVTLDIYPWKKSSFRISAGVLFNQNEFTGNSSGDVEINGITYPGEKVTFKVTQDEVCPYVSIGGNFFYFDKARRWSMGGEIGVAYTGSWDVKAANPTGGIPQSELDQEEQDIEDEIKDFPFWPVLKLCLSFRF
jgi:hypothetical protein